MTYLLCKTRILVICNLIMLSLSTNAAVSFDDSPKPAAPDYSLAASWAAQSGTTNPSQMVPHGASPAIKQSNVDVFYIHPTTIQDKNVWNQDLSDSKTNAWTDASVIARQASVFNHCCEIYAPRYRQASFRTGGDPALKGDGGKAYQLAYGDILRAFDYYLEHYNRGKAFIIAGHSQGALMSYWLLRDRIDNTALQKQLVVAYVIGIDLMAGDFGRTYHSITQCTESQQTGCILSWNSATDELNIDLVKQYSGARYAATYGTEEGRQSVCVNPLTFSSAQPSATADASKGAIPGFPGEGRMLAMQSGKVAAECKQGYLIVKVDPVLELTPLPGGSMHFHDIGLFYGDIQHNVVQRISHFFSK